MSYYLLPSYIICNHMDPAKCRVEKNSQLYRSETEKDSPPYVVFEEGLVICINNTALTKFSVNVTLTVKCIVLLQFKFLRYTQCRV